LGMLLGGYAGSFFALPMRPQNLRGLFGCFLMLASLLLWWRTRDNASNGAVNAAEEQSRA
jgi:uncharacterized membrane protein YfcA